MEIKAAPEFYISAASVWEIAITHVLGKIKGDPEDFHLAIDALGLRELAIRGAHVRERELSCVITTSTTVCWSLKHGRNLSAVDD